MWRNVAVIIAQTTPDIGPAGYAGWSAFGLSGLILAWLFFKHLPDKDAQLAQKDLQLIDMVNAKDARMSQIIESFDRKHEANVAAFNLHAREVREDYNRKLDLVIQHCKDESQQMLNDFRETLTIIKNDK